MGGSSAWNLAGTVAALAVQLVLGALLIPGLGLRGAAVALGAGVVCSNVVAAWFVHRRLRIRVVSAGVVASVALTLGVFLPVELGVRAAWGDSASALAVASGLASLVLLAVVLSRPRVLDLREGWQVLRRGFGSGWSAS
jgi:O-antigen/teichoic acid export membrane protein